ncbi:MAG: sulfite exporter TauE/SafE family protein [Proteobacteria bacterium]|nr:sulfite exporter TauE/SafE family protein [Pseudomonadota bacterium]
MDPNFIPLIIFSFLSYLSLAFAGFGSVIIPITLGAHLYPIKWMLPILVPLTLISNFYILLRHHQHIDKAVLFKKISPLMGVGLVIGILIFNFFQGEKLKIAFGILVVLLSVRELVKLYMRGGGDNLPLSGLKSTGYIVSAGIVHGIYASGGPLLVYVVNKLNLPKSVFRSTLSAVWLAMNLVLTASYLATGKMSIASCKLSLLLLPSMVLGLFLGEILHRRIDERWFKVCVFLLLLGSGFSIVLR